MDETPVRPPAGWYPDPEDSSGQRWWSGEEWTEHVSRPQAVVAASGPVYAESAQAPLIDEPYEPMVTPTRTIAFAADSSSPKEQNRFTVSAWLLALTPVLHVIFVYSLLIVFDIESGAALRIPIYVVPVVLAVVFAFRDRAALRDEGFTGLPHPLLAIIPPLYLGLRATRLGSRAIIPVVVWVVVQAAAVVFFVSPLMTSWFTESDDSLLSPVAAQPGMTAPYTAAQYAYLLTPVGMAQKIASDFAVQGSPVSKVSCEPLPSTELTATTTCSVTQTGIDLTLSVQVVSDELTQDPFAIITTIPSLG